MGRKTVPGVVQKREREETEKLFKNREKKSFVYLKRKP